MTRVRRILLRAGLVLVLLAGAALASLNWIERQLIYPFGGTYAAPSEVGLQQVQEWPVDVPGAQVMVWWAPPAPGQPVIVYLHGNGGTLTTRAARFRLLTSMGYGLLAPSYRGAAGSTGTPSEPDIIRDMGQIWSDSTRLPGLEPDTPRVIYGESLGTGVALALETELRAGGNDLQPQGIVLEAPYLSTVAIAAEVYQLPDLVLDQVTSRWDSASRAPAIAVPVLILHGTADRVIPYDHGRMLFDLLGSPRRRLITVPGGSHFDLWTRAALRSQLFDFLSEPGSLPPSGSQLTID